MATIQYTALCRELYTELVGKFERSQEEASRFAARGTAQEVLNRKKLIRIFRCLTSPDVNKYRPPRMDVETLADKLTEKGLHDFLAVLIFSTSELQPAQTFMTKLLIEETLAAESCSLPSTRQFLTDLFEENVTPDRFLAQQAIFCPVDILRKREIWVKSKEQRLPYIEEKQVGRGASGEVYMVKIAKGHFWNSEHKKVNAEPEEVARKDCVIEENLESESAQTDRAIMKLILALPNKCDNIIKSFGAIFLDSSKWCLFMPLAICDLGAYMTEYHKMRPSTVMDKVAILKNARGLTGGLVFLHTQIQGEDGENLVLYHMDLKPANILIFRRPTEDADHTEDGYIWKISDFGMSRVKVVKHTAGGESVTSSRNLFARWARQEPQAFSPSPTKNGRLEGTYLAPESLSYTRSMTQESDVWSLGCVISVVFAYLEEGGEGVKEYARARNRYPKSEGYDRFFLPQRTMVRSKPHHPSVLLWHKHLIGKAYSRNVCEGNAVKFMLRFLEREVLQDQKNRCSAKKLEQKLKDTCKKYEEVVVNTVTPKEGERLRQRFGGITDIRRHFHRTDEPRFPHEIDQLMIAGTESYKGCDISPDGSVIAFWTDNRILVYMSQSLNDSEITPVASWELKGDIRTRILKSVSLTERYLVASTSGSFQFYLFDLQKTSTSILGSHTLIDHSNLSEITNLAISPNSKTIAFILRGNMEDDEESRSRLLYRASVKSPKLCELEELRNIGLPMTDIIRLSFSTNDDFYYVVEPSDTDDRRNYCVSVFHISLKDMSLQEVEFASPAVDHSVIVDLFTTFSPFHRHPDACALVTSERKLHIQTFNEKQQADIATPGPCQCDIGKYRVLRIMTTRKTGHILAIGRPVASHKMLLLSLKILRSPQSSNRDGFVDVVELASIPGLSSEHKFKERLCEEEDEIIILLSCLTALTSLAGKTLRSIYRISISLKTLQAFTST
ncbi:hypothetical protein N7456_003890 [Penicillium angulare]|uniref:non-specific serine/threonine protein kinase n=1 Tax=Penicillium angulare TaxID=116970 RepID=A0A9W9FVF9_9EURO|nr:hypothetical protein N7456_003890 [Penicillium angulare]